MLDMKGQSRLFGFGSNQNKHVRTTCEHFSAYQVELVVDRAGEWQFHNHETEKSLQKWARPGKKTRSRPARGLE